MRPYIIIGSALATLYLGSYMALRFTHVIVHYKGWDANHAHGHSHDWPAWHALRPASNRYLWPIETDYRNRSVSSKRALFVLAVHYLYLPISACEEMYWARAEPHYDFDE